MPDVKKEIRSKIFAFSNKVPLRLKEMSANEAAEFKAKMLSALKSANSPRASEKGLYDALSGIRLYFEE